MWKLPENKRCYVFAFFLLLAVRPPSAYGAPLLLDAGSDPVRNNGSNNFGGVVGYRFTVDQNLVQLTQLGVWDGPGTAASPSSGSIGDGLEEAAEVGLWRESDMTLIASAIIPVGTSAPLTDDFRYVPITQVGLVKDEGYVLGSLVSFGGNAFLNVFAGDSDFSDLISAPAGRFVAGGSLVFPSTVPANTSLVGFAGPNAMLVQVPEPAAGWTLLMGMLGTLRASTRRRRVRQYQQR